MAFTLLLLPSLHKQMVMSVGYLLYLRISLKRPKIRNLFALCDCFSPVFKRWSPRVGDGEKVKVKV